jgi:hypothetical protein
VSCADHPNKEVNHSYTCYSIMPVIHFIANYLFLCMKWRNNTSFWLIACIGVSVFWFLKLVWNFEEVLWHVSNVADLGKNLVPHKHVMLWWAVQLVWQSSKLPNMQATVTWQPSHVAFQRPPYKWKTQNAARSTSDSCQQKSWLKHLAVAVACNSTLGESIQT